MKNLLANLEKIPSGPPLSKGGEDGFSFERNRAGRFFLKIPLWERGAKGGFGGGILLLLSLLFAQPAVAQLQVFACEPEWAALAEEIGGDDVEIYTATTAFQDPHHIEARPSLIAQARQADLLVCSGAELEIGWLPLLLRSSGNSRITSGEPGYFEAAMQVERLQIPAQVNRTMGDVHPSGNPHVHLDPRRLLSIAEALTARLATIDPENAADYRARFENFEFRWKEAIARWEERAAPLKGARAVVHHKNWAYLFDWLGVERVAELEPKPGLPPTASHLAELNSELADNPPDMIVRAAYNSSDASEWLAERTGAPAVELPYTVGGADSTEDLFGLFEVTLDRILAALNP